MQSKWGWNHRTPYPQLHHSEDDIMAQVAALSIISARSNLARYFEQQPLPFARGPRGQRTTRSTKYLRAPLSEVSSVTAAA
jgi:hypothetical protein